MTISPPRPAHANRPPIAIDRPAVILLLMKLLILGGSGFLSGTIARRALALGWEVHCLTRGRRPLPTGVHPVVADRQDIPAATAALNAASDHWDAVIDCIAYNPAEIRQDLQWFTGRCGRFVFISTDFVYDPDRRRFPQPIDSPLLSDDTYGGNKSRCEQILRDSAGLDWTIFRPCHIYGPGSLLGCLPRHGRDEKLIDRLRQRQPLTLIGGGHFLQQPIFAPDLASLILAACANPRSIRQTYPAAGPQIAESVHYYHILADALRVPLEIIDLPVGEYLNSNPLDRPFLCHRIYDLSPLSEHGLPTPATPLEEGLNLHLRWILNPAGTPL